MHVRTTALLCVAVTLSVAACGSSGGAASSGGSEASSSSPTTTTRTAATSTTQSATSKGGTRRFKAEVWADNWFSLTVNGKPVGEDSVSITTERSFNAETIEFDAAYPLTIALVSKDFKEDDTGLEYIGTDRQQMGDGGVIAQITDTATGKVVAVTGDDWRGLVIHKAPLDTACEKSANPTADCAFESSAEPDGWTDASFDDSAWVAATTYTADEVGAKEGYTTITWDPSAKLIWTSSLKQDNTILWRHTVAAP